MCICRYSFMVEKKSKSSLMKSLLAGILILIFSIPIAVGIRIILISDEFIFGLSEEQASMVISMIEGIVAAVSISFLVYQLQKGDEEEERQRNIAEAQFILQYNRVFIENKFMLKVEKRLENYTFYDKGKKGTSLINKKNRQYFINYLVYFEGLASSIMRDELNLEHIDNLMAYRFFMIINNPEIQEIELFRFPDYYRGCFNLYKKWKEYRVKKGREILQSEHSLDKWPDFDKYIEPDITVNHLFKDLSRKICKYFTC